MRPSIGYTPLEPLEYCDKLGTNVQSLAKSKLLEALQAFRANELTLSVNLYLESWRILLNECESDLYTKHDAASHGIDLDYHERVFLSHVALEGLVLSCFRNKDGYRDETGDCKLTTNALRYGFPLYTTTQIMELADEDEPIEKTLPLGSAIAHALPLKDPVGRLLDAANSFSEAGEVIRQLCYALLRRSFSSSEHHSTIYEAIRKSLHYSKVLFGDVKLRNTEGDGKVEVPKSSQIEDVTPQFREQNDNEDEGDQEAKKETKINIEKKVKQGHEDEQLNEAIKNLRLANQDDQTYMGKSFEEMQAIQSSSSDEENETSSTLKRKPLSKAGEDMIAALEQFHVTATDKRDPDKDRKEKQK